MRERENQVAAMLGDSKVLQAGHGDVSRIREKSRRKRLVRLLVVLGALDLFLWYRTLSGHPLGLPSLPADWGIWAPMVILVLLFAAMMLMPLLSGRSPHVMIRPEHIEVGLQEIQGLAPQVDEVIRSLNVFLGYATFREVLAATPGAGSSSRALRGRARRSWPRRWPSRPASRSCSSRPQPSSRCGSE